MDEKPLIGRKSDGTFGPGNPGGGRPKIPAELVVKCRDLTPEVIDFWVEVMRNKEEKAVDRLRASENIIERAYGKAAQNINANVNDGRIQVDTSKLTPDQVDALVSIAVVNDT